MANSADRDIQRAKDMRALAKGVRDPDAKRTFEQAAARLEKRGAQKASKIGKRRRQRSTTSITGFER